MILIWLGFEKYRFLALIPYHFVLKYANVQYSFFQFYFTASLYIFYFILLSKYYYLANLTRIHIEF